MKKWFLLCTALLLLGVLQVSCSSSNTQTGDDGGSGEEPTFNDGWVFSVTAGVGGNSNFRSIGFTRDMFETSTEYLAVISTNDPAKAYFLRMDKGSGSVGVVEKDGYYINGITENPDGDLLGVCQTGMDMQPFVGNVTVFSETGGVLQETALPDAMVRDMLVTVNNGVVFGVQYLSPPDLIPALIKVGFDGIKDWERQFTDVLDPELTDGMTVKPGAIAATCLDADGNIIVGQNIAREPVEGDSNPDKGYAIYRINPEGQLLWSKPIYLVNEGLSINAVLQDMVLLADGTIIVQYVLKNNGVAGPVKLDYLDQHGDIIRAVHMFPESEYEGRLALTADGDLVYGTVDYNTNSGIQSTLLYKINLNGGVIWKKTYYETATTNSKAVPYPRRVYLCDDGGFLLPCTSHEISALPNGGGPEDYSVLFIKTDANGNQLNNPAF